MVYVSFKMIYSGIQDLKTSAVEAPEDDNTENSIAHK
jgi:hypothetical protein